MNLRLKLPSSTQTAQVFAVTCLVIYGWTTYRFLETLFVYSPVVFAGLVIAAILLALREPVRKVVEDFAGRA